MEIIRVLVFKILSISDFIVLSRAITSQWLATPVTVVMIWEPFTVSSLKALDRP
jgi:hypothetical protein